MKDLPYTERELERLSRTLRVLARRLVLDEETADDLVQEAWLAALEQPPGRVRDMTGWLRTVLRNIAWRHHRRSARRRELEERASRPEGTEGSDRLAESLSSLRLLQRTVEGLGEPYREVIRLRYFDELSAGEIAERLERPEATVKSQLKRGLQRMRERLDGAYEGDRRAWVLALLAGLEGPHGGAGAPGEVGDFDASAALRTRILLGAAATVATLAAATLVGLDAGPVPEPARPVAAADRREAMRVGRVGPVESAGERDALVGEAPRGAEPAPVATAPAGAHRLAIDVVDPSGVPVPGATVQVAGIVRQFSCDDTGHVELHLGPNELYDTYSGRGVTLIARATGLAESLEHELALPPETIEHPRELRVELRGPEVVAEVEVVDASGQLVPGTRIYSFGPLIQDLALPDGTALSEPRRNAGATPDGTFRLENLAPVERTYHVRAPGYALLRHVEPAGAPGLRRLRFVLDRGATLSGVVRDPDGTPLANARVWTDVGPGHERNPVEAYTDAAGAFRLAGLGPGRHFLFARDPHDAEWVAHLEQVFVADEEATWDATVEPRPGVRVLCLRPDGTPQGEGSMILRLNGERYEDWVGRVAIDEEGRAYAHPVPDGPFRVAIIDLNMRRTMKEALILDGVEPSFDEQVLEVEVHEPPEGRVIGVLRDAQGEVPLDARLRIESVDSPFHRRSMTDATGAFELTNIPAGQYELILRLGGTGLAHLGSVDMPPGPSTVDLGVVTTPALLPLDVDWRWPRDEPCRITIQAAAWFPDRRPVWRWQPSLENAPGPLPGRMHVFPGHHCIIVERDGEPPRERRIFIESPQRIVFGPEDLYVQGFRFTARGGLAGGVDVVVGRSEAPLPGAAGAVDLSLLEIVHEEHVDTAGDGAAHAELTLPRGHYLVAAFAADGREGRHVLVLAESPTLGAPIEVELGP